MKKIDLIESLLFGFLFSSGNGSTRIGTDFTGGPGRRWCQLYAAEADCGSTGSCLIIAKDETCDPASSICYSPGTHVGFCGTRNEDLYLRHYRAFAPVVSDSISSIPFDNGCRALLAPFVVTFQKLRDDPPKRRDLVATQCTVIDLFSALNSVSRLHAFVQLQLHSPLGSLMRVSDLSVSGDEALLRLHALLAISGYAEWKSAKMSVQSYESLIVLETLSKAGYHAREEDVGAAMPLLEKFTSDLENFGNTEHFDDLALVQDGNDRAGVWTNFLLWTSDVVDYMRRLYYDDDRMRKGFHSDYVGVSLFAQEMPVSTGCPAFADTMAKRAAKKSELLGATTYRLLSLAGARTRFGPGEDRSGLSLAYAAAFAADIGRQSYYARHALILALRELVADSEPDLACIAAGLQILSEGRFLGTEDVDDEFRSAVDAVTQSINHDYVYLVEWTRVLLGSPQMSV